MTIPLIPFISASHRRRFAWGLFFLACIVCLRALLYTPAEAQTFNFSCVGPVANGNLFRVDTLYATTPADDAWRVRNQSGNVVTMSDAPTADPTASGQACAASQNLGVFGRILCFYQTTIGQVMSHMYCYFQDQMKIPLAAALTLFVVIYGLFIVTGTPMESNGPPISMGSAAKVFLKVALIWAFATNADYGIGLAYKFFMGALEQGSQLMLSTLTPTASTSTNLYASTTPVTITTPDLILGKLTGFLSTGSASGSGGWYTAMSHMSSFCIKQLVTFAILLIFCLPGIGTFFFILFIQYLIIYGKALISYLAALVLIAFLFIFSPLFLSFALFKTTMPLFQKWLTYLISFSLQVVFMFAFLALINFIPLGAFATQMLSLIREYDNVYSKTYSYLPAHMCSICDYKITQPGSGTCTPNAANPLQCVAPSIACTTGSSPSNPDAVPAVNGGSGFVLPLMSVIRGDKDQGFLMFVISWVVSLWVVAKILEDLLDRAPEIARQLGGAASSYTPILSGGGMPGSAGTGNINYIGMDRLKAGTKAFENRFSRNPLDLNWKRRVTQSFGAAFDAIGQSDLGDEGFRPPNEKAYATKEQAAVARRAWNDKYVELQQKLADYRNAPEDQRYMLQDDVSQAQEELRNLTEAQEASEKRYLDSLKGK